jgi:hypothetical protein
MEFRLLNALKSLIEIGDIVYIIVIANIRALNSVEADSISVVLLSVSKFEIPPLPTP